MIGPKSGGERGPVLEKATIKRRTKRRPRRLVESVPQDWARWDAAAAALGLNFAEFARRALNAYATKMHPPTLLE
jgi:hypothetical protein